MASVDRIVVDDRGASRTLSPEQWKALALMERMKLLPHATFFAGRDVVPRKVAVSQLK